MQMLVRVRGITVVVVCLVMVGCTLVRWNGIGISLVNFNFPAIYSIDVNLCKLLVLTVASSTPQLCCSVEIQLDISERACNLEGKKCEKAKAQKIK
jgi:hypothetical protein